MSKKLIVLLIIAAIFLSAVYIFKFSGAGAAAFQTISRNGKWLLPLIGAAAIIDSVNVCAFSVLLLTVGFLFSAGVLRSKILKLGGAYIFGIFLAYLLIGLGILRALYFFNTPHFVAKIGAVILLIFGAINIINRFFPAFPIKLKIPQLAHRKIADLMRRVSAPAAFFLGGFVGLSELPCTAGPYLVALGLLHDRTTYLLGFGYLVLYNLIFILPLVIMLLIASNQTLLARVREWRKNETGKMRLWSGIAMIILGLLIFML
jgi:cytochrome c biogenesis protein CcdA